MTRENKAYTAYQADQAHEPADGPRGFVLLVAGVAHGRRKNRALEASEAALAGWVGLPPQILIPDAPADVVQLPAGSGPQTVRGYLERASVTRGPVLVYLTGHLMPDRRGELHVTLRDSSPGSVRYDGLPWAWLAETLRIRDPRQTLVIADLTATDALRASLTEACEVLTDRLPLWAVLTPPASHDEPAHAFTRTLTVAARRGFPGCPALLDAATIHPAIFGRAQLPEGTVQIVPAPDTTLRLVNRLPAEGTTQSVVSVPRTTAHTPPEQPHSRQPTDPTHTPHAPRHARPRPPGQQTYPAALRETPDAVEAAPVVSQIVGQVPDTNPTAPHRPAYLELEPVPVNPQLRVAFPSPTAAKTGDESGPGHVSGHGHGVIPSTGLYLYRERVRELRDTVAQGRFDAAVDIARGIAQHMETRYGLGPEHRDTLEALETWAWVAAQAGRTAEAVALYTEAARRSSRIHGPGHDTTRAAADAAHTLWLRIDDVQRARDLGPTVVALRELVLGSGPHTREAAAAHLASLSVPRPAADEPIPPPPELRDALAEVAAIAATGRYDDALSAADAVVAALAADLGREHPHTLNVREVRAYLTAEAGRLAEAVTAYLEIAESRRIGRGAQHPDTISAADNAHALWLRLADDDPRTAETGCLLVALREHVPGPGGRALADAALRLAAVSAARLKSHTEPRVAPRTEPHVQAHTEPSAEPLAAPRVVPHGPPQAEPAFPKPAFPGGAFPDRAIPDRAIPEPAFAEPAFPDAGFPEPAFPEPAFPDPTPPSQLTPAPQPVPPRPRPPEPARRRTPRAILPSQPPAEVREFLHAIKQARAHDNHVEALTIAEELMRGIEARHGPGHPYTLNAFEVRAHLTASAGLFATAARQYTTLAHRLAEAVAPDDPGARSAADAAQSLWLRLGRTEAARNLGPGIVDLRRRVPGPDGSALDAARDHLGVLSAGES